jgi:ABC-type phosphate transport system permease subunit
MSRGLQLAIAAAALPLATVAVWGGAGLLSVSLGQVWSPPFLYGITGLALGSVLVAVLGALLALWLGEGAGGQIAFGGSGRALRLLSATPGVALAAGLLVALLPLLHRVSLGEGAALAALGLGLLQTPLVAQGIAAALLAEKAAREGAIALGARADDVLRALRGALRGVRGRLFLLAATRITGEAAVLSVLIGNAGGMPRLFAPSGALAAALLAQLPQAPAGGRWQAALGAMALVIALLGGTAGLIGRVRDAPAGR